MNKLFTILINFSDHSNGVGQYQASTAAEALKVFIETNEALDGYNREQVMDALRTLVHIAGVQGTWSILFDPEKILNVKNDGGDDNPVVGGFVVQAEQEN